MEYFIKPILGIIASEEGLLDDIIKDVEGFFGKPDIFGEWRDFDHTDYYEMEMGKGLRRCFVSFERLMSPESSVEYKRWLAGVEDKYRHSGNRTVNLDAGYIDANKVVLMSAKHGGNKISVGKNTWADLLLWYNKGWVAQPWAFPDFRDGGYFETFMKMRSRFKEQSKKM
ncbi:MAG: DUF4416 family protein [Deltaproteobacteria bacterium]|nr:DUF4416 family protein [Deltaproteobacteria bacterium]